jgi:hypothetical protein
MEIKMKVTIGTVIVDLLTITHTSIKRENGKLTKKEAILEKKGTDFLEACPSITKQEWALIANAIEYNQ